jgi:hypothetical protein
MQSTAVIDRLTHQSSLTLRGRAIAFRETGTTYVEDLEVEDVVKLIDLIGDQSVDTYRVVDGRLRVDHEAPAPSHDFHAAALEHCDVDDELARLIGRKDLRVSRLDHDVHDFTS